MENFTNELDESIASARVTVLDGWPCYYENSLMEAAVTEAARELQVSREMAMMCAFGAMATACQGHVDVQMPSGHQVPTTLMLLTIADSGERKTTTLKYFAKTIHELNNEAYQDNEAALKEHRYKHQLWSTHKRHLERMYSKCAAQESEEAAKIAMDAIDEYLRTEPQPSRSGKFLYEDTTPQALVQMLYENTPNGCLLTSEANSIFSGRALGELDKLNTLWDGGSVIVDRVSREGFILQNARLTLSLMAQSSVINAFMGKRGDEARGTGFLARFLVAKPTSMAGWRTQGKLSSQPRQEAFNARVREYLTVTATPEKRQVLRFSEPATNLWYRYGQQLELEMQDNGLYHYLKDHASKLLENTSRLAAILHTFERTSDSDIEISLFTLKFCWEFTRTCSKHFIEHLANEPQIVTDANHLACFLLKTANDEANARARDRTAAPPMNNHQDEGEARNTPPQRLMIGVKAKITLTTMKKYGPNSLRGRANSARLDAAIELLTKLGHLERQGSSYTFQETILPKWHENGPLLRNGEIITIKELPMFSEQEYWRPDVRSAFSGPQPAYFIKIR